MLQIISICTGIVLLQNTDQYKNLVALSINFSQVPPDSSSYNFSSFSVQSPIFSSRWFSKLSLIFISLPLFSFCILDVKATLMSNLNINHDSSISSMSKLFEDFFKLKINKDHCGSFILRRID